MSQPYIGEIRMFAGNFAPAGWMFCNGQLLPISENDTLFNLIGTTYGGDGQETFALPNLQSRVPIHAGVGPDGVNNVLAETRGVEEVTLTVQHLPNHGHGLRAAASVTGAGFTPATGVLGKPAGANVYASANASTGAMKAGSVGPAGGSQPHTNLAPHLCIHFIISLFGIYPSPN